MYWPFRPSLKLYVHCQPHDIPTLCCTYPQWGGIISKVKLLYCHTGNRIFLRVQKLETNFVKTQMHKKVRMLSYKWIHPIVPYLTIAIYLAYVHDPALYFDIFSCSLGFSRFLSMMLFGKDVHTWSCWPPMKNKIKTRVLSYLSANSFHWVMEYLDLVSKIDLIVVLHFKPNASMQGRTKWRNSRLGTG